MGRPQGPQLVFSDQLHASKYRTSELETYEGSCGRVARALQDDDDHGAGVEEITLDMRFLFAGRIQVGAGAPHAVTLYNCFAGGTIADSFVDGDGSIMHRATQTAQTMRMGGGLGDDFSTLRPKGDIIKGVMAKTDGALAFLPLWDAICKATSSAGNRRGALMGTLRIDYPDIRDFIRLKQRTNVLEGFNLSVGVTDEFMRCLATGELFPLQWGGKIYELVDPRELWEELMKSTWDWGDPGVVFIDTINRWNNLWYCETIATTNPCGEQPLPPFGACLLGSLNLARYVFPDGQGGFYFDWELFCQDIPHVVRAMDNVVDRSMYPLPEQRREAESKRRMGLGITALANAAEALGFPYGTKDFLRFEREVLRTLRDAAYEASALLAAEKGAFPLYDEEKYLQSLFIQTLPERVRDLIRKHGIRNSHLLSIAPTGTISFCADYVSSGVEPVFEYEGRRRVIMPDGGVTVDVSDYGFREFGVRGKLAHRVTAQEHIDVLATAQSMVDSAVSKTCNVDGSMPWEEFKDLYRQAWERGCKGCTTFNKDGKRMGILMGKEQPAEEPELDEDEPASVCYVDPVTGRKECG